MVAVAGAAARDGAAHEITENATESTAENARETVAETVTDAGDDQTVEVIVVTGEKIARSLEEVTASVEVVTAAEIAREPVADLYEIVERIPNVTSSLGGLGFAIRGIDQRGIGSAGNGQTLTIYVDDAPLGNFTTFFGPLGSWDLGQVEVYRGPQSTNFGRNALAGAVYVRTQDPSYDWEVKARAEIGEYDTRQLAAAVSGPLVDDRIAFRLTGDYRETDGFIDNTFLDEPADATELKTGRLKFLFDPAENVRIITTTSYTENFAGEDGVPASGGFAREVAYDTPGREGTETFLQSVNATWEVSDRFEIQSLTSFQTTDYVRTEDFDLTPAPIAALDRTGEDEALAQELRFKYQGDRLSGALGFYFVDTRQSFDDTFTIPITIVNPALPLDNLVSRTSLFDDEATNYAVFFDGSYRLGRDVDLLFGGRYDYEDQTNVATAITDIVGDLPPGFEFLESLEGETEQRTDADFEAFLPKMGLRWRASEAMTLAFVAQKAYRAGGAEINVVDGGIDSFDPEYLWNYELSARGVWLDGRLRWNANVFYSDWTDQQVAIQVSDTITNLFRTVNAGQSTLYGLETDITWVVDERLEVYGGLGITETEFDDFPNPMAGEGQPDNFAGNAFPFAPQVSLNAGFDYRHPSGLFTGIDVNYQSSAFSDQENFIVNEVEGRTLVNARLGYAVTDNVQILVYARNLLDEDYFTTLDRQPGNDFARVGAPRVIAARLDVQF